jgi:hypothetical protein
MSSTTPATGYSSSTLTPSSSSTSEHFGTVPFDAGHANLEFLRGSLPDWYVNAPRQLREALRQSQLKSELSRHAVEPIRARLMPIEKFATARLEQAIFDRFKLRLDVTSNQLVTLHAEGFLLQTRTALKQSLLHAALQNFEASEASDGGLGQGAALLPANGLQVEMVYGTGPLPGLPRFRYRYNGALDIRPEAFAELSRALDLGGQYQAHLDSVFKPAPAEGQPQGSAAQAVASAFMNSERDALGVLAHLAHIRQHLDADSYSMLLEVAKPHGYPLWHGRPVRYRQLHMLDTYAFPGSTLYGALLIEPDQPGDDLPCVVYLPGDPEAPLKKYASFTAFIGAMRRKFFDMKYQEYFQRFVGLEQSHLFFAKLNERLTPLRPVPGDDSLLAPHFDANAELYLQKRPIDKPPFETLYEHLLTKTYADARIVAVPTHDEDRKSRLKRWRAFESVGMDLLMVAGFFVPALGAGLAVLAAGQLLHEAFVAVEDWTHGETEEALNHLFDIGENLAAMAALGTALHLAPRILPSSFVESLAPVKLLNGLTRLWKPELAPFQQDVILPKWLGTDAQGCVRREGKTWLPLERRLYRIELDPQLNKWRIQHPSEASQLAPLLEHNGEGAWRHEGENPMEWDEITGFKRLHADHEAFSDATADQVLRITGANEAMLRQVHIDNLGAPALLRDTAQRFGAEQQVEAFIDRISIEPDTVTAPRIGPFLKLLTSMPNWPTGVALRLLEEQDVVLETWNAHPGTRSVIQVTYTPGSMTTLLGAVLDGLAEDEIRGLLTEAVDGKPARVLRLAEILGEQAQARKARLRDDLHALESGSTDPLIKLVRRDFPALPDVVSKELLGTVTETQHARMVSARRLPLSIAEQAREYLQQLRINRANEGFFLKEAVNPDTITAGWKLLPTLSGWPADLALELRDATFTGPLLDSVGDSANAATCFIVARSDAGYQAFNMSGEPLGQAEQPFFTALLDAMPVPVRRDIGLPDAPTEQALRTRLGDLAVQQRDTVARMLGLQAIKPGFKWPQRLADGRTGYPMSGRMRGLFRKLSLGSRRASPELAVKALYPTFSDDEIKRFLDGLKAAHQGPVERLHLFIKTHLDTLAADYRILERTLEQWSESPHVSLATRNARRVAAFRLRNCWRRASDLLRQEDGEFAYKLDLNDLHVGSLPSLNGNWDHVGAVELKHLDLHTVETNAFLSYFKRAFWVSLRGNSLTSVPEALSQMTRLERLSLAENPLILDQPSVLCLNRCIALRSLDLGLCPVGEQVHRLTFFPQLRTLRLRGTGLETVPEWVWRSEMLRHLDLRDNQIAELTGGTLSNLVQPGLLPQLHDNPINEPSMLRARMMFSETELRRMGLGSTREHIDEVLPPSTLWLTGVPALELQPRLAKWTDLQSEPDGAEFFRVLNELTQSADFIHHRAALTARVWRLIDATSESTELREELFEMAAHPVTCGDGVAIVFSNLEIHAAVFKVTASVAPDEQPGQLFRLVRGLERLDEVEKHAGQLIAVRKAANVAVDEAEVRLAFRVGLAHVLDLPGQPEGMLYTRLAGVTQDILDDAYTGILANEGKPEFLQALIARDFWMTFLERQYAADFAPLKADFQERMEALDNDRPGLTDQHYLARVGAIERQRNEALNALAYRLSLDVQVAVVREEAAQFARGLEQAGSGAANSG